MTRSYLARPLREARSGASFICGVLWALTATGCVPTEEPSPLVAVAQRTAEIGLMKAPGATGGHTRLAFLSEAALLSCVGALAGYGIGQAGAAVIRRVFPVFPPYRPDSAELAGLGTAVATGLLFGVMPARRAAQLDPIQALMRY